MASRVVRFVQLGSRNSTLIHNLAMSLSRAQSYYEFQFDDDFVALRGKRWTDRELDLKVLRYMQHRPNEYGIGVTSACLPDELMATSDQRNALISTYNWDRWSNLPLMVGMKYLVASVMLDSRLTFDIHYDTRGCPNDYCEDRRDVDIGITRAQFCDECERNIEGALNTGRIGLAEVVAVRRILDYSANRRIACVLMPFAKRFNVIYRTIQEAVQRFGWECMRADSLYEAGSIVRSIEQMIGRADLVIADLTGRNPNVFFELGYAQAIGKRCLLLTQDPTDVPFDLRHQRHIDYSEPRLRRELEARLTELHEKRSTSIVAPASPRRTTRRKLR